MVETPTTKEITTNVVVGRAATKAEVVDVSSSEYIIEKSADVLGGLFLKYEIKI